MRHPQPSRLPLFGRRAVLLGGAAALAAAGWRPLAAAGPAPTPAQTEGPYYPNAMPLDQDADLVRVAGRAAQALGTVAHVAGRVLDTAGRPIPGALVEIWQCDANGRYIHTRDSAPGERDGNFQGFGKAVTAADGGWRFRTIRPVPYPGRTPHIHFAVRAPGRSDLVTQLYVEGDPGNARDGVWGRLTPAERALVTTPFVAAPELEAGALKAVWDIVLA